MNYFSIFGLPNCYQIDIRELTFRFYYLQRQHHPDKFVKSSKKEQLFATEYSAIINQAWKTLRNPISRADHLLSLYGYFDELKKNTQDKKFLNEQFSLREELEKINKKKDDELEEFILKVKNQFDLLQKKITIEFNNKEWKNAIDVLHKLHFFSKLYDLAKKNRKFP